MDRNGISNASLQTHILPAKTAQECVSMTESCAGLGPVVVIEVCSVIIVVKSGFPSHLADLAVIKTGGSKLALKIPILPPGLRRHHKWLRLYHCVDRTGIKGRQRSCTIVQKSGMQFRSDSRAGQKGVPPAVMILPSLAPPGAQLPDNTLAHPSSAASAKNRPATLPPRACHADVCCVRCMSPFGSKQSVA